MSAPARSRSQTGDEQLMEVWADLLAHEGWRRFEARLERKMEQWREKLTTEEKLPEGERVAYIRMLVLLRSELEEVYRTAGQHR